MQHPGGRSREAGVAACWFGEQTDLGDKQTERDTTAISMIARLQSCSIQAVLAREWRRMKGLEVQVDQRADYDGRPCGHLSAQLG